MSDLAYKKCMNCGCEYFQEPDIGAAKECCFPYFDPDEADTQYKHNVCWAEKEGMLDEELRNRFLKAISDAGIPEEDLDTFFTDGTMEELRDILQCAGNDIDKIYFEDYVQTLKERINYGEEEE